MPELDVEEEYREKSAQEGEERRERPRMSLEERIRRERKAREEHQKKIYFRWGIAATIFLILFRFLGFNEAYVLYVTQNMDFYHVTLEKPVDMTAEEFLSDIRKEAGANGLMLFGIVQDSWNEKARRYGGTVDIYCSEGIQDYLKGNRRIKEGTFFGLFTGRVDVAYHDFTELSEVDLNCVSFRAMGTGKGIVQFAANVRSFCKCEFSGGGASSYENYMRNCRVILCLVAILIVAFWLFYYLYFVRHFRPKITRQIVVGYLIAMVLIYGAWWQIGVRLAYGKYEQIVREKGLYSSSYTDPLTKVSFDITKPNFPTSNSGQVCLTRKYGDDGKVSLLIFPKMYGISEYELNISYWNVQGQYPPWDTYRVNVDTQMEPVGDNDVRALVEYEKNYDLLCEFWDTIEEEGWLE